MFLYDVNVGLTMWWLLVVIAISLLQSSIFHVYVKVSISVVVLTLFKMSGPEAMHPDVPGLVSGWISIVCEDAI